MTYLVMFVFDLVTKCFGCVGGGGGNVQGDSVDADGVGDVVRVLGLISG